MRTKQVDIGSIPGRIILIALTAIAMLGFFTAVSHKDAFAESGSIHLADMPLEVRGQAAPPLVNISWDASGSMLWTFFTEDDRYDDYGYVFPERDYYYGSGSRWGQSLPDSRRNEWQATYAGYNYMYYDPDTTYDPWPRWNELKTPAEADAHADIDNPRYHPMVPEYTFDLNADFYNFTVDNTSNSETVTLSINPLNLSGNWALWNGIRETWYYSGRSAIWNTDALDPTEIYNVEIFIPSLWNYDNHFRSEYTVIIDENEYPELTLESAGSGWKKLEDSSGLVEFQFPTGNGSIRLNPKSNGWQCADDVRFVPVNQQDGKVIFAHYFTENENGVFLINLDGAITYYEAELGSNLNTVDSLIPMTQEEAEAAGIVTGRTYIEERQNFADWYQFYRRRYFTGISAVGKLIEDWSNVFIRITSYSPIYSGHNNFFRGISPIDVTVREASGVANHYDERDEVLSEWYRHDLNRPWGGTPLRRGLYQVGQFFETGSSDDWSGDRWANLPADSPFREYSSQTYYPYFTPEHGGECQQAFAIVMTDGMWNGDLGYSVGNADATDTDFSGGVFADSQSNTAADVAMHFYHRDLRPDMQNLVPTSDVDEATHQHMVTYGISFGIPGQHFTDENRQEYGQYLRYGVAPEGWPGWPSIVSGTGSTIDDLWHATINGRGEFFSAGNPDKLIEAMTSIKDDIEQRTGTAAAVSTSTVRQQVGTRIFQAQYNSSRWSGDLLAKTLDGTEIWSASDQLNALNHNDRVIFTYHDQNLIGVPFRYDNLSSGQQALVNDNPNMVSFLRGDRGQEIRNGGTFRNRASKLGDIVHSEPAHHNGVVYVGANDGMLHAFDSTTGDELFAYVPNLVFENLEKLTEPDYIYQYFVNGPPFVRKVDSESILVGGLRRGGKGYYALDVTNAHSAADTDAVNFVKWEFTPDDDIDTPSDLGYSYSTPFIMKTEAAGWVVIFGNGYNSENEEAVLFVLDIDDGSVIKKFHTGVNGNGIVGNPSPVDLDLNGYIDFVYAGDIKGNLWKFDFRGENVTDWKIAYNSEPLFTARNEAGDIQPITTAPDIMFHCDRRGYMVIFGTGMFDSELDFGNTETQSIYGIWDWQAAWEYRENDPNAGDGKHLGNFTTDRKLSNLTNITALPADARNRLTLLQQEVESEVSHTDGETYHFITDNEIKYWDPFNDEGDHLGWYLNLPQPGERVVIDPQIRAGHVWVMASIPSLSPCVSGGSAILYALNACTGGEPSRSQFDATGDGVVSEDDLINDRRPGAFSIADLPPGFTILEPGLMIIPDPLGEAIRTWTLEAQRSRKTYWYEW